MAAKRAGNRGRGRPKGSPNKTTVAVKQALISAFDQLGGVPALVRFGRKSPGAFYALWAKLLPTEVKATGAVTVRVEVVEELVDPDDPPDDPPASGPE